MSWRIVTWSATCSACMPLAITAGQETPPPQPAPAQARSAPIASTAPPRATMTATQAARLAALSPGVPEAYLLLAEEVSDAAATEADRRLAIELYVRALSYAMRDARDRETAASAAYGLAAMATSPRDVAWLRAMGDRMGGARSDDVGPEPQELLGSEAIDAQVATFIGYVRSGDGVFARQLLRKPEVASRLDAVNSRLVRWGYDPGSRGLVREASRWPCGECGNAGVIRRPSGWRVCPECSGTPGPKLSRTQARALLRVELWLLRGGGSSWGAQVAVDGGEPLSEAEENDPARVFGVDLAKPRYVEGAWIAMVPETPAPVATPPASPALAPVPVSSP